MKKLTKDQRYYRKKKKAGRKDTYLVAKPDGSKVKKVSLRTINISISTKAFERLIALSERSGLTRWRMLSRIILLGLTRLDHVVPSSDKKISYKGTTGERQVTYQVSSTAYNKLEDRKKLLSQSKARIVQSLILNYKPMSEEEKEKRKAYLNEQRKQARLGFQMTSTWGENTSQENSKFFVREGRVLHVKDVPPENWDEDESDEYQRLLENL